MNFLRLPDPLLTVLFEDDDIIAIDKPYGFNAHTNDSKVELSEFVQDGLIEMFEKQRGQKLHIIHRLDQTTTGVMIFGKSVESAKKYAAYFFNREVQKTYWFITKNKSLKSEFMIDKTIIHKGRELEANTDLILQKKSKEFELWKASPHTGRNHQIRIHAQTAGISILGDPKYDGANFPFLCLHNHKIEFPNGIGIVSKPPVYFEDLQLLEDQSLVKALFEVDRRSRLFSSSVDSQQSYRLVHNKNNAKESGFSMDQFGENIVMDWYHENWSETESKRFKHFANILNKPVIVRFEKGQGQGPKNQIVIFPKTDSSDQETAAVPVNWTAREEHVSYEIRTDVGQGVGLHLSQRLQRNWVLENAKDKSVLNLFSYTSSFGLSAALGEANQVTSVDASKNALNWARANFELNGLQGDQYKFLLRDSMTYLEQCLAKKLIFDLIICDAPSFFRREKGIFKIESGIEKLLENALLCLEEKGDLLFSTNFDGFFINDVRSAIVKVGRKLKLTDLQISCILPALDFELPDEKTNLKSFLISRG
ncbi:MAG: class I SAM-dependent methyltransferase [Bdellovibrio sp.]|nr:class I SAM-dependent methyltransferase [Bdellovibrio sp.]